MAGGPCVPVRWGDTVVDAVWDTGAGVTVVDRAWAEAHPHAVTLLQEPSRGTDVTGAEIPGARGLLSASLVAGQALAPQECGVVDLSQLNAHLDDPIRLIIGLPQIVQRDWYVDFRTRVLAPYPTTSRVH
ncbi:hypothetical protein DT076_05210 [Desertihabitans brevis]|uniref:Peptidase A2 domain-containing protein n=1 Tax=Desertihabitans brevis TaxID=2268447 RepID=A0A367YY18_9ACTN|nr:hypothetical protein DT076_05210 [Desertihabitans brevis]